MAAYYVYSGATGSGNGSSWANAYTTLGTAFSGKAAGDLFYVAHDHAESAVGITLTIPSTLAIPSKIVCVNRSGSVPPVSADRRTTAAITATANNNISIGGWGHFDGIIFIAGSGASSSSFLILCTANFNALRFDNCSLRLGIAFTGSVLAIGGSSGSLQGTYVELNNTTMSFANAGHSVTAASGFRWRNTPSALLGTIPTLLFSPTGARGGYMDFAGVDLSAAGSGKTLVVSSGGPQGFKFTLLDCKLDAAVTKAEAQVGLATSDVDFVRSGSSGVNYTVYRLRLTGALTEETTIVRTGGASDGTTPLAWKIVTTVFSNYTNPFECPPIAIWNDTTGASKTATVEGVWGGGAVPNDDDVWLDVEYLGDASSPQGSFVNDGKADLLTTAAGQTPSSATWGGSTTKFKLAVTFTPQQKGWIYCRVRCAKASTTFYIDPLVTLT